MLFDAAHIRVSVSDLPGSHSDADHLFLGTRLDLRVVLYYSWGEYAHVMIRPDCHLYRLEGPLNILI